MEHININQLSERNCVICLVDPQPRVVEVTKEGKHLPVIFKKIVEIGRIFKIPVIVTRQYMKGLGDIDKTVFEGIIEGTKIIDKVEFNCFDNIEFIKHLNTLNTERKFFILAGVEAHICILQTALAAIEQRYNTIVLKDATSSREEKNCQAGLDILNTQGATIMTTEMWAFLLTKRAGTKEFKEILTLFK